MAGHIANSRRAILKSWSENDILVFNGDLRANKEVLKGD